MATVMQKIIFAVLVLQWASAAPSDVKLEDIAEIRQVEDKADVAPATLLEENSDDEASQGQRRKRWYNYYGFPPFNPIGFSRDDSLGPSVFGAQDPLINIHRRLQEINNIARQPPIPQFPPPLPQFPAFVPIIYIPQVGCGCTPDNTPQNPSTDRPTPPQGNQNTTDNPGVSNRWPEMDDERQNWGIVMNGTEPVEEPVEDVGDGSRPISFDPITPIRPMNRPAPPVEHGSSQAGDANGGTTTTTTARPAAAPGGFAGSSGLAPPSPCDGAILSCCHQAQVTYDCFALQGCPDPSSYGNPCDPGVIFRVIERFQRFYGQRNG
ncbi:uncharacterized protein LOC114362563 [Ostrinia furnacalis]|uniref:uncharacterized protein LOC114362563 n=1 Tax=Ostrinia furnacalis TaxID=93504 RepID=UPI001040A611|nr:uncharacterized protein LOC114362563 [Ostrinia furnacalis]